MQRSEMETFIRNLVEVIWERHEDERLCDFYHPELEGYYNDDKVNFEQLKKKVLLFKEHMSGMQIKILDLLIEENGFGLHALQKLNREGREFSIQSILIGYLKEGKVHKYWLKTEMPLEFN